MQVSGPSGAATGHNGITGKTGLSLKNAAVTIHSNQDGLKTTLDETDVAADSSLAELGNMEERLISFQKMEMLSQFTVPYI